MTRRKRIAGKYLSEATSVEAQLALSYLVWPKNGRIRGLWTSGCGDNGPGGQPSSGTTA